MASTIIETPDIDSDKMHEWFKAHPTAYWISAGFWGLNFPAYTIWGTVKDLTDLLVNVFNDPESVPFIEE